MPIATFNASPRWISQARNRNGILMCVFGSVVIVWAVYELVSQIDRSSRGYINQWDAQSSHLLMITEAWLLVMGLVFLAQGLLCFAYLRDATKPPALAVYQWGFQYQLDQAVARCGGIRWDEVVSVQRTTFGLGNWPALNVVVSDPQRINAAAKPNDVWFSGTQSRRRTKGIQLNLRAFDDVASQQITALLWQGFTATHPMPQMPPAEMPPSW